MILGVQSQGVSTWRISWDMHTHSVLYLTSIYKQMMMNHARFFLQIFQTVSRTNHQCVLGGLVIPHRVSHASVALVGAVGAFLGLFALSFVNLAAQDLNSGMCLLYELYSKVDGSNSMPKNPKI